MRRPRASLKAIGLAVLAAAAGAFALGGVLLLARSTPPVVTDAAQAPVPTLSAFQMAGQRVIYSFKGPTPPASLLSLISHGEAAGVIFFGDNIENRVQLRATVRKLQQADQSPDNPVHAPLLLMADQEGGQIRRLSGAPRLSEKQVGQAADPSAAATAAGTGAAPEPARRRPQHQSRARARRLPGSGRFRRPRRALLQHEPHRGLRTGRRLHRRPAAPRRRRHGQALPGARRGDALAGHRQRAGHTGPVRHDDPHRRRAALRGGGQGRGEAGDGVLGRLPVTPARPARRPGPRRRAGRATRAARLRRRHDHRRARRPRRWHRSGPPGIAPSLPREPAWTSSSARRAPS